MLSAFKFLPTLILSWSVTVTVMWISAFYLHEEQRTERCSSAVSLCLCVSAHGKNKTKLWLKTPADLILSVPLAHWEGSRGRSHREKRCCLKEQNFQLFCSAQQKYNAETPYVSVTFTGKYEPLWCYNSSQCAFSCFDIFNFTSLIASNRSFPSCSGLM